jgi:hypothetical protein
MRTFDGVVKSLEAVELAGANRQVLAHIHAHNCSAISSRIPSTRRQKKVRPRQLAQIDLIRVARP